jgi:serine/threonine protein kinase
MYGRYQPVSLQGKGTYGIVVAVYDHELKRGVAVKKIRKIFCDYTYAKRCLLELEVSVSVCVCAYLCDHVYSVLFHSHVGAEPRERPSAPGGAALRDRA